MPLDLACQLTGRSSVGRAGLVVHLTAGWVDQGFHGTITLEVVNCGSIPVTVERGARLVQGIFFRLDTLREGYKGAYIGQAMPKRSKYYCGKTNTFRITADT